MPFSMSSSSSRINKHALKFTGDICWLEKKHLKTKDFLLRRKKNQIVPTEKRKKISK